MLFRRSLFLAKVGIVNYTMLQRFRKYAIVLAFVIGAILTPPDVFTQFMMAIPLIILYEVSVLITRVFGKKNLGEREGKATGRTR